MSSAPDDHAEHPDPLRNVTEAGPEDTDLTGLDDVDPDDEDAEGEPTGFGEADLDPDDEDS